jgi:hypothetical protein
MIEAITNEMSMNLFVYYGLQMYFHNQKQQHMWKLDRIYTAELTCTEKKQKKFSRALFAQHIIDYPNTLWQISTHDMQSEIMLLVLTHFNYECSR